MVNMLFSILQEITLTHHEVVEHSVQDTEESLSSWREVVGGIDLEEEIFEMHPQESRTEFGSS